MKLYETIEHVNTNDSGELIKEVSLHVNRMQKNGLRVEVQYQQTPMGYSSTFSAMILGYKEV